MVGDRLDSDILFGTNSGFETVLVMSGTTTEEQLDGVGGRRSSAAVGSGLKRRCGLLGSGVPHCTYFSPSQGLNGSVTTTYAGKGGEKTTCTAEFTFDAAATAPMRTTATALAVATRQSPPPPTFALVAYAGVAWFVRDLGVEMCAVVQCQDGADDLSTSHSSTF